MSSNKSQPNLLIQKSRLCLDEGNPKEAMQIALKAVEIGEEHNPTALFYVVRAYIELGNLAEAKSQMEFLKATHKNIEEYPHFFYLQALIVRTEGKNLGTAFLSNIRQAVDLHFALVQRIPYGLDYIEAMDATFLVEITQKLFEVAPSIPSGVADPVLKEIERILVFVYENCPGLAKPLYLLSKVKYLSNDNSAEALLRSCIEKNTSVAEAYLLLAQIYVQKHNLDEAAKLLDVGLGFNFKVREHPFYYLTKARLDKRAARVESSINLLRTALDLPIFSGPNITKDGSKFDVTESDRIAIYLELIDSLQLINHIEEADSTMAMAVETYSGKPEEQQLLLMNAQLQLRRGNVDGALSTLNSVQPDQPNYQSARIKMAQIYLEEKHDKHKFALCYREILEKDPSPIAYELLGDAYISIQEPTLAIEAYETSMRRAPKNHQLAEKIGNAYVKCHLYRKAITFYEAAMKSGRQNVLRIRFAEQLFQMGNYEKCKKVLNEVLDEEPTDTPKMRDHVAYRMLLSKLHLEENDWGEAIKDLLSARELQLKIVAKASRESLNVQDEKKTASDICCQLAGMHANRRDWNRAIELYKEAISLKDKDIKVLIQLAGIYMAIGKLQQCNQQCQAVLSLDPNNSEATLLMADLMYQRNEGEESMKHFSQALDRNPNHYHALARYIELGWRRGNYDLVEKALKNAIENNPRATVDAGYNYCKGLVEWYTGEPNEALQAFNRARRDLEWGERALYNMIEICLNPDNEIMGEIHKEFAEMYFRTDPTERDFGTKTAQRFFKELRVKSGMDRRYKLMENFILLASPNKLNVQKALNNFSDMCKPEGNLPDNDNNLNVGAILGSARACLLLKQTQKAKIQLKRIVSYPWSLEEADYLQQCWLLLADLYINQGKSDQAIAVLRTVLQHNASSSKAFEYMGFLCEREQKYADAASNYEAAWNVCKKRNPAIGYKLAYNYFKCRRLFECIEVCHTVLKNYPTYPKIKKEILDKARTNLRM